MYVRIPKKKKKEENPVSYMYVTLGCETAPLSNSLPISQIPLCTYNN